MGVSIDILGQDINGDVCRVERVTIPYCIDRILYNFGCSGRDLHGMSGQCVLKLVMEVGRNMRTHTYMKRPSHGQCKCPCYYPAAPKKGELEYVAYQTLKALYTIARKYHNVRWIVSAV